MSWNWENPRQQLQDSSLLVTTMKVVNMSTTIQLPQVETSFIWMILDLYSCLSCTKYCRSFLAGSPKFEFLEKLQRRLLVLAPVDIALIM